MNSSMFGYSAQIANIFSPDCFKRLLEYLNPNPNLYLIEFISPGEFRGKLLFGKLNTFWDFIYIGGALRHVTGRSLEHADNMPQSAGEEINVQA